MENCIFCHHLVPEQILCESKYFQVVYDIDPIQSGHLLIISKEHYMSLTELPVQTGLELIELQKSLIKSLEDSGAYGVTIAANNGKIMDQRTHYHIHLIPRYQRDGFWDNIEVEQRDFDRAAFKVRLNEEWHKDK